MNVTKANVETLTKTLNETLEDIRLKKCALAKYEQEVVNKYYRELDRLLLEFLHN